jgi:hypothetical protein
MHHFHCQKCGRRRKSIQQRPFPLQRPSNQNHFKADCYYHPFKLEFQTLSEDRSLSNINHQHYSQNASTQSYQMREYPNIDTAVMVDVKKCSPMMFYPYSQNSNNLLQRDTSKDSPRSDISSTISLTNEKNYRMIEKIKRILDILNRSISSSNSTSMTTDSLVTTYSVASTILHTKSFMNIENEISQIDFDSLDNQINVSNFSKNTNCNQHSSDDETIHSHPSPSKKVNSSSPTLFNNNSISFSLDLLI